MKKLILFLLLILVIQNSLKSIPVAATAAAEEEEEATTAATTTAAAIEEENKAKIIKVIEEIVNSFAYRDLDGIMKHISKNYYVQQEAETIDYNEFRARMEDYFNQMSKQFTNISCGNLMVIKFDFQDNKANLEIDFDCKGFNLDALKDESERIKKLVHSVKEDDIWRIVVWASPPPGRKED
jgi:hypothetical protein